MKIKIVNKKISVVVPCFNEEENILETYTRLINVLRKCTKKYEIIFIDNGSTDGSRKIFKDLVRKNERVKVIVYSRNFGPHGAYSGGLKNITGDAVLCIDADLQDPPELLPQMIEKWQQGYDVVYGARKKRKGNTLRKILTFLYYRILNRLSDIKIPLDAGDFALMDRTVVNHINSMPEHNKYFTALRAWVGFAQYEIPYNRAERKIGKTKIRLIEYIRWALQNICSFSYRPLELISYLTIFVIFLTGVGILLYFFNYFFYPSNIRDVNTIVIAILFMGAIQLLCLSIMSQYLSIIFEEAKNRPQYIIRKILKQK